MGESSKDPVKEQLGLTPRRWRVGKGALGRGGGEAVQGPQNHSAVLKAKNDAEFGRRRHMEPGAMRCESLDEQNGKQDARFVRNFRDIAIAFTFPGYALFSLRVAKAGTKLECVESPTSRFRQVLSDSARYLTILVT